MQAFNFVTMNQYSGKNAGLVSNGNGLPAFATFQQLKSAGYSVLKGAKGVKIFCGYREKKDSKEKMPLYATVFDIIDTSAKDDAQFLEWLGQEAKRLFTTK